MAASVVLGLSPGNTSGVMAASSTRLHFRTKLNSELGFLTSQLGGIKISSNNSPIPSAPISAPLRPALQPVARRVCPFTGKKANKKNLVSFSNHKTKKLQFVNLQYKKVWWEAGKRFVKLRLSTKALKTIEKNGLDAVAKKAGIDLRKE
ncbi:50S ribosomal protein L28, chloroplastic [Momordica charantia]|uniref:Large ribosomal subunit protein bL28c n=1 Tax=Momordica charantia TaxID=3673 RepID=A0A6J1CX73_MOMCH|nr:50S ribosomal protein L28, chloroplastic [Momordica charantia]